MENLSSGHAVVVSRLFACQEISEFGVVALSQHDGASLIPPLSKCDDQNLWFWYHILISISDCWSIRFDILISNLIFDISNIKYQIWYLIFWYIRLIKNLMWYIRFDTSDLIYHIRYLIRLDMNLIYQHNRFLIFDILIHQHIKHLMCRFDILICWCIRISNNDPLAK